MSKAMETRICTEVETGKKSPRRFRRKAERASLGQILGDLG